MMVLVRDTKTDESILGHIVLDGALICYTCENREKAIPVGLYNVQNSKSPKFKRELPLLYNAAVHAKRGIRIHSGNSWKDSSGCVLVGMGQNFTRPTADPTLLESKPAETMVAMLCRNICQLAIVDNT